MVASPYLSFRRLQQAVYETILSSWKALLVFVVLNMVFSLILIAGLGGVGTLWFLLWGAGYYFFNFVFFRWYFRRQPYLLTWKFFDTLLPAVKVLFVVMAGVTLLAYLPYFPLLFGGTSETLKKGITWFIGGFMGESNAYNFMISLVMLLISPIVFYRPLLAWVSSVIGRSGSFQNVFKHTGGYYKLFLKIAVFFYIIGGVLWGLDILISAHGILFALGGAPLSILFNLFLAKTYEILILD